jgi:hypothetical protein
MRHPRCGVPCRASLQKNHDAYYCQFWYDGTGYTFTGGPVPEAEVRDEADQVDCLRLRIRQGPNEIPPGRDVTRPSPTPTG